MSKIILMTFVFLHDGSNKEYSNSLPCLPVDLANSLFCCQAPNGQTCCSGTRAVDGTVVGCGCKVS